MTPLGDGRYAATIHPDWDIFGAANGGYVLAIAGRAMADAAGRPPVTVTGHYLAPTTEGDVTVDTHVVRSGRRFATVNATVNQNGRDVLAVLGTFGDRDEPGFSYIDGHPPELPPFDDPVFADSPDVAAERPNIFNNIETRMEPHLSGFRVGIKSGEALLTGWLQLRHEEPIDAIALLLCADAFPPPIFNLDAPVAWVPTVELTVHVRGVPAPGPLRCRFATRFISDGLLEEDGEIWDTADRLVCQSRQLALLPRG